MADLSKLYELTRQNRQSSGGAELLGFSVLQDASERAWKSFTSAIVDDIKGHSSQTGQENTQALQKALQGIAPAIQKAIQDGIGAVLGRIGELESLDEVKSLIKSIRVPDHRQDIAGLADAIRNFSIPKTDLEPIMLQLDIIQDALEKEDEEKEKTITWDIERDPITKLLTTVSARVTEE